MSVLTDYYDWIKAIHVIAVIAWMVGLLYLPRLFVYHVDAPMGSQQSETFKVMEWRLNRVIMNPAMVVTWMLGILMLVAIPDWLSQPWFYVKAISVMGLTYMHHWLSRRRKEFQRDANTRTSKIYRIVNEVPTVLMIAAVITVIVRPFQ